MAPRPLLDPHLFVLLLITARISRRVYRKRLLLIVYPIWPFGVSKLKNEGVNTIAHGFTETFSNI